MMLEKLNKFILLTGEEKRLFFVAVYYACSTRIMIAILPFRRYAKYLGIPHKESAIQQNPDQLTIVYKVFRAMRRSSVYLPFREKCLVDAIVIKKMLLNKGIESTLYLGVSKDSDKQLIAHAWLRCGENIVTGRKGLENYKLLEWFT
jgi:hypothetical protein